MIDRCFSSPEAVRGRKEEELTPLHERQNLIKRGKITPHEVRTKNHKAYKDAGLDHNVSYNVLFSV